jgi:hypothetical protein
VSDVIGQLTAQYEAPSGKIEEDVLRTLAELYEEGLIQIHANNDR